MMDETGKFVRKAILLFSLTLLPLLVGKLLIPMDWYSFRCWETLIDNHPCVVHTIDEELPFFYPNASCVRTEEGDLAARSRYAVKKDVEWFTDDFGHRNKDYSAEKKYEVVLVGDSDIVGTSLTQKDTLAEVLSEKVRAPCYAWAPDNLNGFIHNERFRANPPYVVVMADNERNIRYWPLQLQLFLRRAQMAEIEREKMGAKTAGPVCSLYNRLSPSAKTYVMDVLKKPWLPGHLLKILWSRLFGTGSKESIFNAEKGMFFFNFSLEAVKENMRNTHRLDAIADAIQEFHGKFAERNILLIYAPIPAKESIYWDLIPEKYREGFEEPAYMAALLQRLRNRGVPVVDIQSVYREYYRKGTILYQPDDSHLNPEGVRIAAELIKDKIAEFFG